MDGDRAVCTVMEKTQVRMRERAGTWSEGELVSFQVRTEEPSTHDLM